MRHLNWRALYVNYDLDEARRVHVTVVGRYGMERARRLVEDLAGVIDRRLAASHAKANLTFEHVTEHEAWMAVRLRGARGWIADLDDRCRPSIEPDVRQVLHVDRPDRRSLRKSVVDGERQ